MYIYWNEFFCASNNVWSTGCEEFMFDANVDWWQKCVDLAVLWETHILPWYLITAAGAAICEYKEQIFVSEGEIEIPCSKTKTSCKC